MSVKKLTFLLFVLLIVAGWTHGSAVVVPQITCNPVTGVAAGATGPCTSPLATCNGVADDTAAFVSFKTWALANQGTNQVKLLADGLNCNLTTLSTASFRLFDGIKNFIYSGYSGSLTNTSSVPILLGGKGQFQDNQHSVRTATSAIGDSCVTLLTQPSTNVSNVANSVGNASFTGSIAGTTLTVTGSPTGTVAVGQVIRGSGSSVGVDATIPFTTITALGTGVGGSGTYTVNATQTLSSQALTGTGVMRLTVASTTGYTDGDTVFVQNIVGSGGLDNATNGLWWSRKIDGTHLDLFQSLFNGAYASGGTVGGDRTALFPTGAKVVMTGYNIQYLWGNPYGFPSNQHYLEYKTVVSSNSSTHQVCFDTPLTNAYKSTWPQFSTGSAFEVDDGGPATLYRLSDTWETTQDYQGLTITDTTGNSLVANGRTIKFTDATLVGGLCSVPSQNETFYYTNVTASNCTIEFDKMIGTVNIAGGTLRILNFQSSSIGRLNISGTTVTGQIFGTPKVFVGTNVAMQDTGNTGAGLSTGVYAYGRSDSVSCTSCVIAHDIAHGGYDHPVTSSWTFGPTGIISIPNWQSYGLLESQARWAVPGSNSFITIAGQTAGLFQVTDVTQDFDNTYIHTSATSGFPAGITPVSIRTHPAPQATFVNSSGNENAVSLSGCAANLPLWSCQTKTYVGGAAGTTQANPFLLWGQFSSLTMTPNPVYAGAGALSWSLSVLNNWPMIKQSDGTTFTFPQTNVDEKTAGTRIVTQSSVTGSGGTDVLSAPGTALWIGKEASSGSAFSVNTAGSPGMTMQMLTNQGVVIP